MFDPGNGGKKICLIDRADYLAMGAPVYPCDMSVGGGAVNGNHAGCKADPQNGDNGKDIRFELHKYRCSLNQIIFSKDSRETSLCQTCKQRI